MPSKKKSRQKKILLSIPLGETKVFSCDKWQNSTLPIMLPSASDTAGIFHNSMGVGVLRWQAQQTHFCKRANFVDGVYIIDIYIYNIYTNISALCVPNVDVSPYSRKVSHNSRGPSCAAVALQVKLHGCTCSPHSEGQRYLRALHRRWFPKAPEHQSCQQRASVAKALGFLMWS